MRHGGSRFRLGGRRLVVGLLLMALMNMLLFPTAFATALPPVLEAARIDGATLALTYNAELDTDSIPAATDFAVTVAGLEVPVDLVSVSTTAVTLTLSRAVTEGESVTLSYAPGESPIQDRNGQVAANLFDRSVANTTQSPPMAPMNGEPADTTNPAFLAAAVTGNRLTLTYDESLDATAAPAPDDFAVTVAGSPVEVDGVAVEGATVILTLASAVPAGAAVSLTYNVGVNPIQDLAGNLADSLTDEPVTNNTMPPADTTPPTLLSADANATIVTLTYSEELDPNSVPTSGDFTVKASIFGDPDMAPTIGVSSVAVAGTTVTLTLVANVKHNRQVYLNYSPGTNPLQDLAGNAAASLTNSKATNSTPTDAQPPQVEVVKVSGNALTICFDEAVYGYNIPAAFQVTYGDELTAIAVTAVRYVTCTAPTDPTSQALSLTLASPVPYGATPVYLSYTKPSTGETLRDEFGNRVPTLTEVPVTNLTPISLMAATVDGDTVTLTYAGDLDESSVPAMTAFTVHGPDGRRWEAKPTSLSLVGNAVTLTLPSRAAATEDLKIYYTPPDSNPLRDATGMPLGKLTGQALTNITAVGADTTHPTLVSGVVNKATVVLTFSEPLNASVSVPPGAFNIRQNPGNIRLNATQVAISGPTVTITLDAAAAAGQSVRLESYWITATGGHLLEDLAGNDVLSISLFELTNITKPVPVLTGATVNRDTLTLTFSANLDPASVPATTDFTVTMAGSQIDVTAVALANNLVTLTLADPVIDGATVTLSYTAGEHPLRYLDEGPSANLTNRAVTNITDTIAPALTEAMVGGATLVLTYDDTPVQSSVPAATDYAVKVSGKVVAVKSVALKGPVVTLTLAAPVTPGAVVTLSYTPGTKPLCDAAGNRAAALVDQAVTNRTGAVLHVGENQTYTTLDAALDDAEAGSIIIVHEGTYSPQFDLTVTQPSLTLRAAEGTEVAPTIQFGLRSGIVVDAPNVTIQGLHLKVGGVTITDRAAGATIQGNQMDGGSDSYAGIYVEEEFTGILTITGNTVQNYQYGIYVDSVVNGTVTISGNELTDNDYGIEIDFLTNATVTIANNQLMDNWYRGIRIEVIGGDEPDRNRVQITGNTVGVTDDGHRPSRGIYLYRVDWDAQVLIAENHVYGHGRAVVLEYLGQEADAYYGQPGYVAPVIEVRNNRITDNTEGIYQYDDWTNGVRVMISGNEIRGNQSGFYSDYTLNAYVEITDNKFTDNDIGIEFDWADVDVDGTLLIHRNTISANRSVGLLLEIETEEGAQVSVMQNSIAENGLADKAPGLYLGDDAQGVTVAHNLFQDNVGSAIVMAGQEHQIRANRFEAAASGAPAVVIVPGAGLSRIAYNQFLSGGVGILNASEDPIDATLNWWGAASGPGESPASQVVGKVSFSPWISGLTWSPASLSLTQGRTQAVTATFVTLTSDSTKGSERVDFGSWPLISSNPAVATVAADGTVKGVGSGTATISTGLPFDPGLAVTVTRTSSGGGTGGGGGGSTPTQPAPTQPAPTQPAPTQPAPTQPAPTQPAPTQPAPTQPAPTQPAPTQPEPTQPAPTQPPAVQLTDIAGHWAEEAIARLVGQGIVSGFADQTYRPDQTINRAEFATLLARALGLQGTMDLSRFTDAGAIPEWAQAHVAALVAAGIVNGRADGSFDPEAQITRVEAAIMLARALKLKGIIVTGEGAPLTLSDAGAIPDWAQESVQAAMSSRLITGYEDGTFRPDASTTRAEMAIMLIRLLDAR